MKFNSRYILILAKKSIWHVLQQGNGPPSTPPLDEVPVEFSIQHFDETGLILSTL